MSRTGSASLGDLSDYRIAFTKKAAFPEYRVDIGPPPWKIPGRLRELLATPLRFLFPNSDPIVQLA